MVTMRKSRYAAITLFALLLAFLFAGGAGAQGEKATVIIEEVESGAFPEVTARVTVLDEKGSHLSQLSEKDFQLFEDGQPLPSDAFQVESDTTQALRLVLVADTSVSQEQLPQIQETARAFIGGLAAQDAVAVVAFTDEAVVGQESFGEQAAALEFLGSLEAESEHAYLDGAIERAITLASEATFGERAVLLVATNEEEGGHHFDDLLEQANSAGLPVFALYAENGVNETLQAINDSLRTSYQITFNSSIKVDDGEHELEIGVDHAGQVVSGSAAFTAPATPFEVRLLELQNDDVVAGTLNLAVETTAEMELAEVEYRLNGQLLARETASPFSFEWNSAATESGRYVLEVRAVDQIGNVGESQVAIEVVPPIILSLKSDLEQVELGKELRVTADVQAVAGVEQVTFLLNDSVIGTDDSAPYEIVLDTSEYESGEQRITARARDAAGWEEESSTSVQFVVPPWRGWSKVGAVLGSIVTIFGGLFLLAFIHDWHRRWRLRRYRLEVCNEGNVPSRYELKGEDPMGAFRAEFLLNGIPLQNREVVTEIPATVPQPAQHPQQAAAPAASQIVAGAPGQQDGTGAGAKIGLLKRLAVGVVGLVNAVAIFLPHQLRTPLLQFATQLRWGNAAVNRFQTLPGQFTTTVSGAPRPAMPTRPATSPAPSPTVQRGGEAASAGATPGRQTITEIIPDVYETPLIGPGESVALELRIDPARGIIAGRYQYKVISRSIEEERGKPLVEQLTLEIPHIPWARRFLPYLAYLSVVVGGTLFIGFLLTSTGLILS